MDCDIVIREAGSKHSSVLCLEPVLGKEGEFHVSMLWCAKLRNAKGERSADARSSIGSVNAFERSRSVVIAPHKPRTVKHGEAFIMGDFEAVLLPMKAI